MAVTKPQKNANQGKTKGELLTEIALLEQRLGELEDSLCRLRTSSSEQNLTNSDGGDIPLKRAEDRLRENKERLIDAIYSLQEGSALFDNDGTLVVFNEVYRKLHASSADYLKPGITFEELLRKNMAQGKIAESIGREEDFIKDRIKHHLNPKEKIIRKWVDGPGTLSVRSKRLAAELSKRLTISHL